MRKTFDDILRQRWEQQQFPVDQDHRRHMLELLEGKKKRRAFGFWWWGAGAVVLVAGYFMLQATAFNTAPKPTDAKPKSVPGETLQQVDAIDIATEHASAEMAVNPAGTSAAKAKDAENESASAKTETNTLPKSGSMKIPVTINSTSEKSQKQTSAGVIDDVKETGKITPQPGNASTETIAVSAGQSKVEIVSPEFTASPSNAIVTPSNTEAEVTPAGIEEPVEAPSQQRSMIDVAWLDALAVEPLPIEADHTMGPIKPVKRTLHPLYAFGEAGAGMILGSRPAYPGGWKLNAGAGLGYVIQPKLHLSLSGGYLLQDGGFDFVRTSTVTSQGFGLRSQVNSLEPDKLHYVYGKLGLTYRINKHSLGANAGMQYLYGAQGFISVHTADQLLPDSETSSYAWLNLNGFDRFQYNAGIQYSYRLTPRFNVSAGAQYYFNELIAVDPELQAVGYSWKGETARVQPFITFNYLLYGPF